jgi:hypothetical protein
VPKPARIALSIFGTIVAIIVVVGIAHPGSGATTAVSGAAASTRADATASATPAPTTTAAAPVPLSADDRFVADVLGAGEILGVGHAICESIGAPGVTHAGLVAELGTSKWGTAVAEVVVAAAEAELCPERHYAAQAAPVPLVAAPAPVAPAAEPQPSPAPRPQPAAQQPAPRREPAREEPSSAAYYKNCAAARAAGAAPLHRGEPGYRAGLDRDDDGVACE